MSTTKDKKLVDELKSEHRNIIEQFHQALSDGIRTEKGIATFKYAFLDLRVHFANEEVLICRPIKMSKLGQEKGLKNIQQYREDHQYGVDDILEVLSEI